jgi:drug/metabolite transporter (DMT)-like permease
MERFVVGFIRSSLIWLGVGVVIGLAMTFWPGQALAYRAVHMHANVLGFVSMMIFGVAYHVIPRFVGNPLHSRLLPRLHLWLANLGLAGMVGGWMTRVWAPTFGAALLPLGALLSAAGTALFIYTLWRTLGPTRVPSSPGGLPVFRVPAGAAGSR